MKTIIHNLEKLGTVRMTEKWNQVPTDITNLRTVDAFKNAYAHHRASQV